MRKKILKVVSFMLMISLMLPLAVFGEEQYDKKLQDAILRSKELFNITDTYDKFDYNVSSSGEKVTFYLNWTNSKEDSKGVNVTIDAEGTVLNYNKYNSENTSDNKLPKLSKEDGLKIAQEFLKKVNPKVVESVKYDNENTSLNPGSNEYDYEFIRIVNGIPYSDDNANIYVDKNTGEVTNYNFNWDSSLKFPDSKNIISLDEAKSTFKDKKGINLVYKYTYEKDKPNYYLAYSYIGESKGVDALTGELMPYDYYRLYGGAEEKSMADAGGNGENLSPDEIKAVESISSIINGDEAVDKARKMLNIGEEFEVVDKSLNSYWKNEGEYVWMISFNKKSENNNYETYEVSVDAKTGELISFYYGDPNASTGSVKYSDKELLKNAQDFIQKFNPSKYKEVELMEQGNVQKNDIYRYFNFVRKSGEAYVDGDDISVGINGVNGKITSYNIDWYKGEFPSQDKIISSDKAYDVLYSNIGMELRYVTVYDYTTPKYTKSVKLCYTLKQDKPVNISATTGQLLDSNGNVYKEKVAPVYKDIDDSNAKVQIQTLADYGIYFSSDEFKPKENIIQKDFLYLICKAAYPYFEPDSKDFDNSLYKYLTVQGIVKEGERDPERVVTKEEGVKFIIRALGYSKVADLEGIYKEIFKDTKDIDPKLLGYVNIAYGLKIIQGSDGKFNPKSNLTRESAAIMIYNYLFK